MSSAGAQSAAFYRAIADGKPAWSLRDAGGFPTPLVANDRRAAPFWSTRSRVERIIANVPAYRGFEPFEIPADVFLERWLPGLARDGLLVGVNWSGPRATGYDIEPAEALANITALQPIRRGSADA